MSTDCLFGNASEASGWWLSCLCCGLCIYPGLHSQRLFSAAQRTLFRGGHDPLAWHMRYQLPPLWTAPLTDCRGWYWKSVQRATRTRYQRPAQPTICVLVHLKASPCGAPLHLGLKSLSVPGYPRTRTGPRPLGPAPTPLHLGCTRHLGRASGRGLPPFQKVRGEHQPSL